MYLCICGGVTSGEIELLITEGITDIHEIKSQLGISQQCGTCAEETDKFIQDTLNAICTG